MNYAERAVITDVRTISVDSLDYPAVTICMVRFTKGGIETFELNSSMIVECSSNILTECNINSFEKLSIMFRSLKNFINMNCYKLNGGKDLNGNRSELFNTKRIDSSSRLILRLNLPTNSQFPIYIGHNSYNPSSADLYSKWLDINQYNIFNIRKNVDEKLPKPFNDCYKKESLKTYDSYLVKQFHDIESYRQVNCYDLCYQDHWNSIVSSKNISYLEGLFYRSSKNERFLLDNNFLKGFKV